MNTDKACEVLCQMNTDAVQIINAQEMFEACHFAISSMREFDSLQKTLRGIVAEFKEEP